MLVAVCALAVGAWLPHVSTVQVKWVGFVSWGVGVAGRGLVVIVGTQGAPLTSALNSEGRLFLFAVLVVMEVRPSQFRSKLCERVVYPVASTSS